MSKLLVVNLGNIQAVPEVCLQCTNEIVCVQNTDLSTVNDLRQNGCIIVDVKT